MDRKNDNHPIDKNTYREYALEDAAKTNELEEARKVARTAIVQA